MLESCRNDLNNSSVLGWLSAGIGRKLEEKLETAEKFWKKVWDYYFAKFYDFNVTLKVGKLKDTYWIFFKKERKLYLQLAGT